MGQRGTGYGSEDHLRRYMTERRADLDRAVLGAMNNPLASCEWLAFPTRSDGSGNDRELEGMEFLSQAKSVEAWKQFWPTTGSSQNWDAVGRLVDGSKTEWLLVEAKARARELNSACKAVGKGRAIIEKALLETRLHMKITADRSWTDSFYQIANRLASLYFLNQIAKEPARLVFVYFTGDRYPDGSVGPKDQLAWEAIIAEAHEALALPRHLERVHDVFLPALTTSATGREETSR